MHRQVNKLFSSRNKNLLSPRKRNFTNKTNIDVSEEVRFALETGKPLVALESTIITHGMSFPNNIECARDVQQVVRKQGAIPATIAILKGKLKVGISEDELEFLGDQETSKPIKTSRRDLPYIISNKLNGGTTVSATLIAANMAGIPIFASGGIGGVHRGAEQTFDVSADLIELGKCGVAVVASGVKSILDIPKTLEFLETQGVFVATFGETDEFPAFYSRMSGIKAPYCVRSAAEAAGIIRCNRHMDLKSGMLFAVPIPEEYSLDPEVINRVIEEALRQADANPKVTGKNITPFLLSQVEKTTSGKSLQSNIALIKNNAKTAADIAVALADLDTTHGSSFKENKRSQHESEKIKGRPVIIGGSNLDCSVNLDTSEIQVNLILGHVDVYFYIVDIIKTFWVVDTNVKALKIES